MQEALTINPRSGWLENVRRVASPYYDARPSTSVIDLIVIHGISLPPDHFGGHDIDNLFTGHLDKNAHPFFEDIADLKVSSHILIDRRGCITQYVSFFDRAWHAGKSHFKGQTHCNDFSIGIELEGSSRVPYEEKQYATLNALLERLMDFFPLIKPGRVAGHCDIAPGRKTDPWSTFDWGQVIFK